MGNAKTARKTVQDDDCELIRAINAGQSERFEELVRKYQQMVYNFGMRMCGEPRDSEDLVQETFLNVYRYLEGFRYETKFRNWMFRIATTVCLKKKRRPKHAPERELSLEEFMPQEGEELPEAPPDWARAPLDQVLNGELARHIQQAIIDLPKKYRMVVALREMEGFSTEETAQILDISTANVKVRLHRARLFLREKLKGYFDHGAA
ncbi:MAG: sigma-70 family RNA polymerase sigma factor [Desulfobacterales bacterium]|nr:sigma-70 family RNA polymerase sigma factor [Desulfobacterales bacterium]MDJ0888754.1 sigma-70 family RNA polymerase sigma factor [Desulfobacterales bacterium]